MIKDNPVIYLFRKMWKYSDRPQVVLYLVLSVFANIIWLLEPAVVAYILNIIQSEGVNGQNLTTILLLLLLLVGFTILGWVFHGPSRLIENKNAFLVNKNYKKYLLDGVMSLPVGWHTDHHSGDTIDKVEKGTQALYQYSRGTFELVGNILRLVVGFIVLAVFNVHSTYILVILITLTTVLITRFDRVLVMQYDKLNIDFNAVSAKVYDTISNIMTVIVLRIGHLVSKAIVRKIMKPFRLYQQNNRINEMKWFLVSVCAVLTQFFVLSSYILVQIRHGEIVLIGTLFLLYQYVSTVVQVFYNFAWLYSQQVERKAEVKNAEILERDFLEVRTGAQLSLGKKWQTEMHIGGLSFSYHTKDGADLHLDDITLTIRRGEKIAFIGESGSGKTTMLKILRGLYTPQAVTLSLDEHIVKGGFETISEEVSLIPQDPEIFTATIKENITCGIPHQMEEIRYFAKIARFDTVALRLPKKYRSSIVEKGVNLSGGEKQRLALARGLLASRDKVLILMDEPTSSVDSRNERLIYEQIFDVFRDKTIISSIHRLHLLPMFDRVVMFQAGKIIADGSFAELIQDAPAFRTLWEKYSKT